MLWPASPRRRPATGSHDERIDGVIAQEALGLEGDALRDASTPGRRES